MQRADIQGLNLRVPRKVLKALRLYAVSHETSLQAIGIEALREWAERHGVDLNAEESADDADSDEAA